MNNQKSRLFLLCMTIVLISAVAISGCTSVPAVNPSESISPNGTSGISFTSSIIKYPNFDLMAINITQDEFLKKGFVFGDSLDISFSNGKTLLDIPFISNYFIKNGKYAVFSINNSKEVYIVGEPCAQEGDFITVSLNTSGKYLDLQKINSLSYSNNRSDPQYTSDEKFTNFRPLVGGNLKKNFIYRGASPIDNSLNRNSIVNSLMENTGIRTELDLSDTPEIVAQFQSAKNHFAPYFDSLYANGSVIPVGIVNINYLAKDYENKIANGFIKMLSMDGPFYINCLEGKERTGFVCMLIEALADASYDEMETDFMQSYDNYYGLTKTSDSDLYNQIKDVMFNDKIRSIAGLDENTETANIDIKSAAIQYLKNGGMTEEQIDAFIKKITN